MAIDGPMANGLHNAKLADTDVMMRRHKVISMVGAASLSLCASFADCADPQQFTQPVYPRVPTIRNVVAPVQDTTVSHFDQLLDSSHIARATSQPITPIALERLPIVRPDVNAALPIASYPRTGSPQHNEPESVRQFDRLPDLNRVAAVEPRPYAVDLTLKEESTAVTPAISVVPQVVQIVTEKEETAPKLPTVPTRRFVETKPPKPPLPSVNNTSVAAPSGSEGWLMTGNALHSVSQRADGMIDRGFRLAEKGAYYSAKSEFRQALRTVSQALDTHFATNEYSEALEAGWLALDEADDFSAHSQRGPRVDVALIVESHQSPILKNYDLTNVSPVLAMQHYFVYAQERLVQGSGRAPVAARALHGLGKIHMVLGEKSASAARLHGPKAMAFHQTALTTDPTNFMAANELGVLLARFGKLQEARNLLQYAVSFHPTPETWQNLSTVHQRLGEASLASQANVNWQVALQQVAATDPTARQANNRSMVQWVPPQAFIGQKPDVTGMPAMPATVPQMEVPVQAKKKSGFLWW